jgi:hypothetical protein
VAAFMAIITINCGMLTTPSDELVGIWKATDIRYNDTYFEIDKRIITFHTKEGSTESYAIVKIEKKTIPDDEWINYTIYYRNRDLQKVEFPFYFRPSQNGVIRFKNQPSLVWKKEVDIKT